MVNEREDMDIKSTPDGKDNPVFEPDDDVKNHTTVVVKDDEEEEEGEKEFDPWALPELQVDFTPWAELTTCQKVQRVLFHYILKLILLLACLYVFICSLSFLGDAFQLLGGKVAGKAFANNEILSNPIAGLMIGVLGTVLLQSSSTTTSIVVSMVASGLLTVRLAIPMVMGANIGTSVTNTIVSLGQIANKDDFRRAFAGATVHDVFNWLTVLVLLPLEIISGYLERVSEAMIGSFNLSQNKAGNQNFLKVITNPFTKLIIQIDKKVIQKIATKEMVDEGQSIIKHKCCDGTRAVIKLVNIGNDTFVNKTVTEKKCSTCVFLFEEISRDGGWSDTVIGALLLIIALFLLCSCLVAIVKTLNSLLKGQIAHVIRKFVNAEFPGKCSYFTGYVAIAIGAGLTVLVQSSSIFTSSLTPLVGIGVLSIERMYPLTLGSNIGTTATGILAAFAQESDQIRNSLQIALCHLLFNVSGIFLFYPLPFFRPAIPAAKFLGTQTAKYRWFALLYLLVAFFLLPAAFFGLSAISWIAMAAVFIPIGLIIIIVFIVKLIQKHRPSWLPERFRNWKWLPEPMRSLRPIDSVLMKVLGVCVCCKLCKCCKGIDQAALEDKDEEKSEIAMTDKTEEVIVSASTENQNGSTKL